MKNINWLKILGIIVGIVVGGMVVMLIEKWGHSIHPPLEGVDMNQKENVVAYMESAPTLAILMVPIAWILGAFIGSFASTMISLQTWRTNRFIVSLIFLLISIMMLITIPSPWYMWVMALGLIFPFGFLGTGLARQVKKL